METPGQNETLSKDVRKATVTEIMEYEEGMELRVFDHGGSPFSFYLSKEEVDRYGLKDLKKGTEIFFRIPDMINPVDIKLA